jgi:hypothetical protein
MLKKQGVPFDTKLLLDDQWREKLAKAFETMPELQKDVHVKLTMKGVYLARKLLTSSLIELTGDTVILAKEFGPDEDAEVAIEGPYRLVIFVIGDPVKYEEIRRSRRPPTAKMNINIEAPCAIVGLAPIFYGRIRCDLTYKGP